MRRTLRFAVVHAIHADRIGNVFDRLFAEILEGHRQLVFDVVINSAGNINLTRCTEALEPGRDIHAIAENIVTLDNNVANVDTLLFGAQW